MWWPGCPRGGEGAVVANVVAMVAMVAAVEERCWKWGFTGLLDSFDQVAGAGCRSWLLGHGDSLLIPPQRQVSEVYFLAGPLVL